MDGKNAQNIDKSIEWIFHKLRRPTFMWHLASSITIATVGFLSKVITGKLTDMTKKKKNETKTLYFISTGNFLFETKLKLTDLA